MRASYFLMFALLSGFFVGGCSCDGGGDCDASRPGAHNGCCRPDGCNAGLTCVETSCQPCGSTGETCCYSPTASNGVCDSGSSCVSPAMGPETCQACGMIGGPCCNGSGSPPCGTGAACLGNVCQSASGLCRAGSTRFSIGVTDVNGCRLREIVLDTDTFAHALECASTMLSAGEVIFTDAQGVSRDYELCVHTRMEGDRTTPVSAYDDYGARTCGCRGVILGCTVDYRACGP